MKQFDTDDDGIQMPDNHKPTYIKEQHNNNCQQFFGPITNCTFVMPPANEKPSQRDKKNTTDGSIKQEKQHGVDYPVFTKGHGVTDKHIKAVYQLLTSRAWISTQTSEREFLQLFSGKSNTCEIIWTRIDKAGNNEPTKLGLSALYVLFKTMHDESLITSDAKVGPILESHFVDNSGKYLINVSNNNTTSTLANDVINNVIALMRTRPTSENIQGFLQDIMESKYDSFDRQDLSYRKRH